MLSFCKFLNGFFFKAGDCKAGIITQGYYFVTILSLEGFDILKTLFVIAELYLSLINPFSIVLINNSKFIGIVSILYQPSLPVTEIPPDNFRRTPSPEGPQHFSIFIFYLQNLSLYSNWWHFGRKFEGLT